MRTLEKEVKKMRTLRVKQGFFNLIRLGTKTLEVRVGYRNIKRIKPGDIMELATSAQSCIIRIKDVRNYRTFQEMLNHEAPGLIVPGATKTELLHLLRKIYPRDREKLGVVVLEIKPE